MQKWEYSVVTFANDLSIKDQTARLNQLGLEGWELVSVIHEKESIISRSEAVFPLYFKRPIELKAEDVMDKAEDMFSKVKDATEIAAKKFDDMINK